MQVNNDEPDHDGGLAGLLHLQSQYQARLTEETLKYLRGVQAAFSPRAPGTIVATGGLRLAGTGAAGGQLQLELSVENRQRVHTSVAPSLTPLVSDDGWTWYPTATFDPVALLLAPEEQASLSVSVQLPPEITPGVYRGGLLLLGFLRDSVPVLITVEPAGGPGE